MTIAHCGASGHRGWEPMFDSLDEHFSIYKLGDKVKAFASSCLLCKHLKGSMIITRPYGPAFSATRRNEAVHWDYWWLGSSFGDCCYVLVLKDSLSHFCELFATASPTAAAAAECLIEWVKRYDHPTGLLSDKGTHFGNKVLRALCERLKIEQCFVPAYMPWLNDFVEQLNNDVLQVI
ncbi:TPA: hypothetical protein N0F65_005109 [Lagenidium giganteum]|uniref:Integrase catalytic domain-containing protein n=1 Tax=Lagenidium giganteum TaxID=4803 RepID=A0AAV2Z7Q9_9STRA|nr:TPA: hypothetical protein N0F65_005109 [Lagenidium giganteum]